MPAAFLSQIHFVPNRRRPHRTLPDFGKAAFAVTRRGSLFGYSCIFAVLFVNTAVYLSSNVADQGDEVRFEGSAAKGAAEGSSERGRKEATDVSLKQLVNERSEFGKRYFSPKPPDSSTRGPRIDRRRKSIWMPCVNETEAERLGIRQWREARPKGASSKRFEAVSRCWRKRTRAEPLLPAAAIPPTGSLRLRLPEAWLDGFLLVHRGNVKRLGSGFADEAGRTLADDPSARDLLPTGAAEAMEPLRSADCAAVGSGGNLHGSALGRRIDRHGKVLRVNEAPIAGFERDVGRRTDVRLVNNLWTEKYSGGPSPSRPLEPNVTLVSSRAGRDAFVKLGTWLGRRRPDVKLRLLSSRVVTAVRQEILIPWRVLLNESGIDELEAAVLEGRDTPSSGLVAVIMLLQVCDKVTVYGFSGMNDGSRYHYYKTARRYQNRTHSFTAERALLRALDRDGHLVFVDGNSDEIHTWI
mmetsp:Transcript_10678/g.25334  ORF Transcript_10678/g.25334 Transcript_10678/m.25334 type:complete len:468 (+) Transcript_10678:174-1577(+)